MMTDTLVLDDEQVHLHTKFKDDKPVVARVTVTRRFVVPPSSVVRVSGKMYAELQDYYTESLDDIDLAMPRTVRKSKTAPVVCLVNPSDKFKTIKKGTVVANAYEYEDIVSEGNVTSCHSNHTLSSGRDAASKQTGFLDIPLSNIAPGNDKGVTSCRILESIETSTREVPDHLKQVLEDSAQHLDKEQKAKLTGLLCDYQDVFAKNEFDLGSFTEMEHAVDTDGAKPSKQRMRRTPACLCRGGGGAFEEDA